jgi:mono/diheme cytochrome c family protein
MRIWIKIVLAVAIGALLVIGGGALYMYSGRYNVAATAEHGGLVRWTLKTAQRQSVRTHADEVAISVPADSAAAWNGFIAFQQMCIVCHGAPGTDRGWMGQGMNPTPPNLSESVEQYSSEELYWILENGIKLAGMPALAPTHSRDEILEIVAFLKRLRDFGEEEYQVWDARLRETQQPPEGAQPPMPDEHGHFH